MSVADRNKQALAKVEEQLTQMLPRIEELLPARAADPMRFKRMAMMAVVRNPKLLEADRKSFLMAVMNAAELGLSCSGGPASRAHLVPFKGKVTCIPDYKGLIDIALDSGFYDSIEADNVHKADEFVYKRGTDPRLEHTPALGDRGEWIASYAIAWPKGGGRPTWTVMSAAEINEIRDGSKGYQFALKNDSKDNMWISHPGEARKKTAIRRLYKLLKTTPHMERAEEIAATADTSSELESIDDIAGVELSDEEIGERGEMLKKLAAIKVSNPQAHAEGLVAAGYAENANPETLTLEALRRIVERLTTQAEPKERDDPDADLKALEKQASIVLGLLKQATTKAAIEAIWTNMDDQIKAIKEGLPDMFEVLEETRKERRGELKK